MTDTPRSVRVRHLAGRYFGSLRPGGPSPADEAWVGSVLGPGEHALWRTMDDADRRHAVGVARRVETGADGAIASAVAAAALLHDVGKIDSHLGPHARVLATLIGASLGARRDERARDWAKRRGPLGRLGRYLRHGSIGADLLAAHGAGPLAVAWAREHHASPDRWTVDHGIAEALKAADDD